MTENEVIEVIKNEKECVLRNIKGCDRSCGKCDLVMDDSVIVNAYDRVIMALQEIQQYRAIGTIREIEPYVRLAEKLNLRDLVRENARLAKNIQFLKVYEKRLKEYEAIGAVEECREAMERQRAKKPKHFYKKYGKHKWRRKENGEIDDFAWEFDFHSGVVCEVCGECICTMCNPNYDELDDCEEEHWNCPSCGKRIGWKSKYCDCGQAIDWSDAD